MSTKKIEWEKNRVEATERWYSVREGSQFDVIYMTEQAAKGFERPPFSELGRPFNSREEAEHHKHEWQKYLHKMVGRSS